MLHIKHTIQRNNTYYFNFYNPVSNKIIRKTLKTDSAKTAKKLVAIVISKIKGLLRLEMNNYNLTQIIENIVNNELGLLMTASEAILRPNSLNSNSKREEYIATTSKARHNNYHVGQHGGKEIKINTFPEFVLSDHSRRQQNNGLNALVEEYDPEFIEHEIEMDLLQLQVNQVKEQLLTGKHAQAENLLRAILISKERLAPTTNSNNDVFNQVRSIKKFSKCIEPYIEQLKLKNTRGTERNLEYFNYFLKDKYVGAITRRDLDKIIRLYANTPKSQHADKAGTKLKYPYRGLNLGKRIDIADSEVEIDKDYLPSKNTIAEAISHIKLYFEYLREEEYLEESPVLGMTVTAKKAAQNQGRKRYKFSSAIMSKLIKHLNTCSDINATVILIMSYTGARNSEILQLRPQDIKQEPESGIWCFHITEEAGSVKNQVSNRWTPIHSKILGHILQLKEDCNSGTLFKRTNKDKLIRYFQDIRKILQIPHLTLDGKLQDLYSLRHTAKSAMVGIDVNLKNAISGHAPEGGVGETTYSHIDSDDIPKLREVVETIKY
jgi:integrase